MVKLTVVFVESYTGYSDGWSGHGHAFDPPNLVACVQISIPVSYRETIKEIKQLVGEQLKHAEPIPINQDLFNKYETKIREIPISEYIEAMEITDPDNEKFFTVDKDIVDNIDPNGETPQFIAIWHIYLE